MDHNRKNQENVKMKKIQQTLNKSTKERVIDH